VATTPFTDVCFRCGRGHRALIVMVGETGGDAEERAAETIGAKA
jgi:hypothetical protein